MFFNRQLTIAATVGIGFAASAYAQGERRITCASANGQRSVCNADTRDGVRMVRQTGSVRCIEGYNWGYTDRDVWVDRGCQAEFALPTSAPRNWQRVTRIEPGTTI